MWPPSGRFSGPSNRASKRARSSPPIPQACGWRICGRCCANPTPGRHPFLQSRRHGAAGRSRRRRKRRRDGPRQACAFVRQIDKLPLPVKSAPGFLVNAVLAPTCLKPCVASTKASHRKPSTKPCSPSACPWGRSNWPTPSASTSPWPAGKQLAGWVEPPGVCCTRWTRAARKENWPGLLRLGEGRRADRGGETSGRAGVPAWSSRSSTGRPPGGRNGSRRCRTGRRRRHFRHQLRPFTGGPLNYKKMLAEVWRYTNSTIPAAQNCWL